MERPSGARSTVADSAAFAGSQPLMRHRPVRDRRTARKRSGISESFSLNRQRGQSVPKQTSLIRVTSIGYDFKASVTLLTR